MKKRLEPTRSKAFQVILLAYWATASVCAGGDVNVSENASTFTLDNGTLTARISKRTGDLISLRFQSLEMLDTREGRAYGYWSHDTSRGERTTRVTINPKSNGGERGEVSVRAVSNGRPMGNGPGGSVVADIEIRYALGRDDSGIYTYSIFTHPTNYPATSVGEARFCAKLNDDVFDWLTVDSNRNMKLITAYDWNRGTVMNMKEARRMNTGIYKGQVEHKYDYSANQFETLAWGWSSSEKHIGIWFVNPTTEFLSGGPTKVELSAHRDATFNTNALDAPAPPCLLNYWRSSHYGGSICSIGSGEEWTKVIGPFLIYCNAADSPDAMWKDALARSAKEAKAWPYNWAEGVDYPHANERGTVNGQLVLNDLQAPNLNVENLLVGLSAPDYSLPRISRGSGVTGIDPAGGGDDETTETNRINPGGVSRGSSSGTNTSGRGGRSGRDGRGGSVGGDFNFSGFAPRIVDWQNDAKYYQFWVRGDASGNFTIPNVRPGRYTLHAIADGVLGEFTLTNVTVASGGTLSLGKLIWQPERYGKQLWDIGISNRKASEFFKGDDYFHWGWYLEYPKLFPNDVNYVIGKSDFRKDWFFEQVPHNENTNNTTGTGFGRSTTWSISFRLPETPRGKATLRLAICGVGTRTIDATMNDKSIGTVTGLAYNATINRDGIQGSWSDHDLVFDASLMKAGENVLKLTIPGGGLTSGIAYDYLRLELDQSAQPPRAIQTSAANVSE